MKTTYFLFFAAACLFTAMGASGCANSDNRTPSAAEGAAADVKRQNYIDTLNIPPAQKAIMKSHMGGNAVADPAAMAAAVGAPPQAGKR